ncbi:hypothetical protein [Antarctobacter jejuensis]|uniref:hypothetical protein n=1 Tax=Antarctobacter jejuensis TaxID=1439938 RepID=UPI003FCF9328
MKIGREYLLYAGAGAIAAVGYWADRVVGGNAFARSGALIVIFGALLAGREIYSLEKSIARHETRVDKIEAAYLDAVKSGERQSTEDAFSRLATNLADFRASRIERVGRLITAEIFILCFGTLIWGFGDLAV